MRRAYWLSTVFLFIWLASPVRLFSCHMSGTSLAFALDGLSFLISSACLVALPQVPALRQSAEREAGILQDMHQGIMTVLHSPWLWVTLVIASVSTIFLVGPAEAVLPLLVKQRFGEQVGIFALLTSLSALGSVLAAFWLGQFKRLRWRGLLTYGSWLLASLALLAARQPGTPGCSPAWHSWLSVCRCPLRE